MKMLEDIIGKRYSRLLVVSYFMSDKHKRTYCLCQCDCGKLTEAKPSDLKRKYKQSCGCLMLEKLIKRVTTHGQSGHSGKYNTNYQAWQAMKRRCSNNNISHPDHHLYYGKGIIVCDRWKNSFENFIQDMGEKPDDSYSLDRIDSNKNYCPENCRWATATEQARNTSRNVRYEIEGKLLTIGEWSEISKINVWAIISRIRRGWNIKDAIFLPLRSTKRDISRSQS